jgi:antitoxin (DNA-binding transcriptional repressor) of toxin-antitoxin stability system
MRTMNASTFKAQCLALLDEVERTGEPLRILKRGKVVAELVAPSRTADEYPQRKLQGKGRITGDLVAPVLSLDAWEADALNLE